MWGRRSAARGRAARGRNPSPGGSPAYAGPERTRGPCSTPADPARWPEPGRSARLDWYHSALWPRKRFLSAAWSVEASQRLLIVRERRWLRDDIDGAEPLDLFELLGGRMSGDHDDRQ